MDPAQAGALSARKQVRGSTLLLIGRALSMGVTFATQVVLIRYLTTEDFGALAYALTAVAFLGSLSMLGFRRGFSRFVPGYLEKGDFDRLLGILLFVPVSLLVLSLLLIGVVHLFPETLEGLLGNDPRATELFWILLVLIPVSAGDHMMTELYASFLETRAIFLRRYLLAPLLTLAFVGIFLWRRSDIVDLSRVIVVTSVAGLVLNAFFFTRMLGKSGILARLRGAHLRVPARDVLGFALPLLTTDLMLLGLAALDVLLLGYFHGTTEVAFYRAIVPPARLTAAVLDTFGTLYLPLLSRLAAQENREGIDALYGRTALWLSIFSFPIFGTMYALSDTLVPLVFGADYEPAARLLRILAGAHFIRVVLGFSLITLQVLGRLRMVVLLNLSTLVLNLVLDLLWIPTHAAWGAAVATAVALTTQAVVARSVLAGERVRAFERSHLQLYVWLATSTALVLVLQRLALHPLPTFGVLTALSIGLVLRFKDRLALVDTFPELLRIPLLSRALR